MVVRDIYGNVNLPLPSRLRPRAWVGLLHISLQPCYIINYYIYLLYMYSVAWQPKMQSFISLDTGDQGGYNLRQM